MLAFPTLTPYTCNRRSSPTQARIVAQAGLIVGAVGLGFAAYMDSDKGAAKHATSSWKLRDYSVAPQQAPAAAAPAEAAPAAAAEPQLR